MRPDSQQTAAIALALAAFTLTGSLYGQAAPASGAKTPAQINLAQDREGEEAITLSPFEVTATNDDSYTAPTTLAGNRLNTSLRDVGSAISVVTAQMLKDIGATSNETLLQYTTNTEVGNIYGNMANAGSGTLLDENSKFTNPNQNTRVRGLASADSTVDYFLTDIPWDNYNVDRVDFQRGPNAILFGLGSPAGIINAGQKSAGMKNKGQVEMRYARFGSVRASLDVNRVLIEKQLALRLDALDSREKFQQQPAYQNDKRVFGALKYEPGFLNKGSAHTTLKVNFEQGNVRSNRPRTLTPGDGITPWFFIGTAKGYDAVGREFQYNNLNKKGFDARGLEDGNFGGLPTQGEFNKTYNGSAGPGTPASGTLNPYWQPWLGGQFGASTYDNPMAIFTDGQSSANRIYAWSPSTVRGIGPTGLIDKSIGGIPYDRMASVTLYRDISKKVNLPGAKFGLTRSITMEDPTIFDFYNNMLDGPNKWEWQNFHHSNFNLSQTFFNGKAGIEAVYDKQHYDNGQMTFMSARSLQLYVDVIQTMPDGTINPNFGRPFIADDGSGGSQSNSDRESFRLTSYAQHDFNKSKNQNLLTRILGKHTLTGLYSADRKSGDYRSFVHYVADSSYKDFVNGYGSNVQTIDSSLRKVQPIIYLGNSLVNAATASGSNIPAPTAVAVVTEGSIRAFDSTWNSSVNPADPWQNPLYPVGHPYRTSTQSENPANYRGWSNVPFNISNSEAGNRDQNTNYASKNRSTLDSKALNWQAYFWDGSLVGMYGYRKDTAKSWTKVADRDTENHPYLDPQRYTYPTTPILVSDNSSSYSAVLHLNQLIKQKLPLNVSFFYNNSENFQPIAGRVSILGNPLSAPKGKTKEYGILLSTKDENYSLKINYYNTAVKDASGSTGVNGQFWMLGSTFVDGQNARNRYTFEVSNPNDPNSYHSGAETQWIYQPALGQTPEQAVAAMKSDVAGWDTFVKSMPAEYLTAWKLDMNQTSVSQLKNLSYSTPSGLTATEDTTSKGLEFELNARPIRGLRLSANASKSEAKRENVGDPTFNEMVTKINTALTTTGAGKLRYSSNGASNTILDNWNANFWATWLSTKGQEGNAVPELRRWRMNLMANYEFSSGFLKGFNVGTAYRWQDKVVLGYKPVYYMNDNSVAPNPFVATACKFDLNSPYYGPAESNIDAWVSYSYRISKKLNWRTQLNVRNIGKQNSLIPITVQPDGTVATWRIAPTQVWSLTNTLEF